MSINRSAPLRARDRTERALMIAAFAGIVAGVYACADSTGPAASPPAATVAVRTANLAATVTPGVVTICKVGPAGEFDVQVGLAAPVQNMMVGDGRCTTLPTITAAPGDDVIVTIQEKSRPYYVLDHILFQHAENAPQVLEGTNTVSFEGVHGANVTFYNDAVVRVCKVGTDATFQYEIGLGEGFAPLALKAGECSNIARIPPVVGDDVIVTVRENASPTYVLDHMVFTHSDLAPVTLTGQSEVSFEGMHGGVVVFHNVPVVPSGGCTYTQGWYKNRGRGALPAGPFYLSGASWLGVLQTEPKQGNPYYVLAHQFIAASLNAQSASVPTGVNAALSAAGAYFAVATPANWSVGGMYTKATLIGWAGILGSYNEGQIGPGHCE